MKSSTNKWITVAKAKQLEESIGFLSDYQTQPDETHVVHTEVGDVDEANTKLLNELGQINARRAEIIAALTK